MDFNAKGVFLGTKSEVTVPAFSTRMTTLTFEQAAEYAYICHLPGHEAHGMVGALRILER